MLDSHEFFFKVWENQEEKCQGGIANSEKMTWKGLTEREIFGERALAWQVISLTLHTKLWNWLLSGQQLWTHFLFCPRACP